MRNVGHSVFDCLHFPLLIARLFRNYVKELERIRPRSILDLIRSGESLALKEMEEQSALSKCTRCGYLSSQGVCKACLLLHGLATNQVNYGVGRVKNKVRPSFP
jgi:cytoplasmic tRNA 2-thiolation protein 1